MHHAHRTTLTALALGIAGVLALGQAHATGFQIRENSVKNLGRANAGTAVAQDDASVVSNNPAAMVNLDRTTVQIDATIIDLNAEFTGGGQAAAGTPLAQPLTGGDGGDPGDPTAVPAIAIVAPLHGAFEGLTVGASISAPFGLATEYDRDWVGRYNAVESDVKTVDFTLSAAVELHETFSVGVGLIYQHADVTLSNAVDFGSGICRVNIAACITPDPVNAPFGPQKNDGFVEVSGTDNGLGWLLGFQFRPTERLAIGYSHHSEIDHEIDGDVDFTVPAAVVAAMGPMAVAYADGPGGAKLTTPSVDTLSVQYDFTDSFRMMADVQRTGWESLQAVNIERSNGTPIASEQFQWEDSTMVALGGEYDLNEAFTLRAGAAVDETPTNDEHRTPRLPDNNRTVYTLGMTWNVSEALSVDAAYMRVEIDSPTVDTHSSSSSNLVGSFDGHADLLGVSAQYRF